jgi:pyruvate/2-oxoglutarate/acetoin dehydrogenase E1 component
MAETRYVKAVARALEDAMADDPTVIVIGEDVAAAGGSFKATRGLVERFGTERVLDAPIAEAALTGIAVGAALSGLRPVAEIMFMDFITLSMDMLVNQAAKARYMFGGQGSVPMVLRTPHGAGLSAGPQHSQCLEAWLAHVPGLKVVVPATVEDAYSLLRAAIADPDPVVVVENKALYALKGDLPETPAAARIGEAAIRRPGSDVTLVTYGATVWTALDAARAAEAEGHIGRGHGSPVGAALGRGGGTRQPRPDASARRRPRGGRGVRRRRGDCRAHGRYRLRRTRCADPQGRGTVLPRSLQPRA